MGRTAGLRQRPPRPGFHVSG